MKIQAVLFAFGCFALQGCGQKGPLYLPKPEEIHPQPQDEPEQASQDKG
jgi:predicted small lipoprotein YifL